MRLTGTEGQGQHARGMGRLCFPASLSSLWGQGEVGSSSSLEAFLWKKVGPPWLLSHTFFFHCQTNLTSRKVRETKASFNKSF